MNLNVNKKKRKKCKAKINKNSKINMRIRRNELSGLEVRQLVMQVETFHQVKCITRVKGLRHHLPGVSCVCYTTSGKWH